MDKIMGWFGVFLFAAWFVLAVTIIAELSKMDKVLPHILN